MNDVSWKFDLFRLNLNKSVGRGKDMQDTDVHGEFKNCVVTLLALCMDALISRVQEHTSVISKFLNSPGASRVCVDFRDLTNLLRFDARLLLVS